MKISRKYLNPFLPPAVSKISTSQLCETLDQLGLSVSSVQDILDDTLIEIEITPNRGDCLSYLGIARELMAKRGGTIWKKDKNISTLWYEPKVQPVVARKLPFSPTAGQAKCTAPDTPVFLLQLWMTHWNPDWKTPESISQFLALHDISTIHPLVDIGNMIMLESGQPIHVYDLDKVQGSLTVRRSKSGEGGKTLSGLDLKLSGEEVVIADEKKVLCVGGVIGMQAAAIDHSTRRFAIEAAHFGMERIRRTCRKLQVATDASTRFERGVDPTLPARALHRYASLIQQAYGVKEPPANFSLTRPVTRSSYAIQTSAQEILSLIPGPTSTEAQKYLKNLGCGVKGSKAKAWKVVVPTYRFDLKQSCDLSEEVARLHGYHRIPADTHLRVNVIKKSHGQVQAKLRRYYRLCDRLVSLGYLENIHVSFISQTDWEQNLKTIVSAPDWVALENPLNQQRKHLPPCLFPLLIEQFQKSVDQHVLMTRIFEMGKTFVYSQGPKALVKEETHIALLTSFSGEHDISHYSHPAAEPKIPYREWPVLAFQQDVISILEELGMNSTDVHFRPSAKAIAPIFHSQVYRELWVQDTYVGFVAQLHPQFDVFKKRKKLNALAAEINLDALSHSVVTLKPLLQPSIYPSVSRDVTVILTSKILHAELMQHVNQLRPELCTRVQLIDTYVEDGGQLSLTFRMHYEDPNKTLSDETVNKWQEKFRLSLLSRCPVKYN